MTITRYKLGRLAARFPVELSALSAYAPDLPAPDEVYDGPADGGFPYGMLGNDSKGDCTVAGFVHGAEAVDLLEGQSQTVVEAEAPSADEVVSAYLTMTNGVDSGLVIADVLQTAYATGIAGIKVAAYAPARGPLAELLSVAQTFGVTKLGIMLPAVAQEQFQAGDPWDLTGTSADADIEGGHDVELVAFDQGTETVDVLTWGRRQPVTFRWLARYLDEAWAVLYSTVQQTGALEGIAWSQLDADLRSLPGSVG